MTGVIKQAERRGKALLMRTLTRWLPTRHASVPDWGARPYRVLYLRYDRIGDMIMSTGLFRALATTHPSIRLDVLASPANLSVLDGNPHVRDRVVLDKKDRFAVPGVFRELRRRGYDAVVDPMVLKPSLTATMFLLASGAPYRIGIGGRANAFVYTLPVAATERATHHIAREGALLTAFGIDPSTTDLHPEISVRDSARATAEECWQRLARDGGSGSGTGRPAPRLLVNVSTHHESRLWPEDRFTDVVRSLRSETPSVHVLLIGLPRDRGRIESIARQSGAHTIATPNLEDALALVATSDVVFTPDTSIAHAGSALHKPVVVMIGPHKAAFRPYGDTASVIQATSEDYVSVMPADVIIALQRVMRVWARERSP